jgi:hypothetical protein
VDIWTAAPRTSARALERRAQPARRACVIAAMRAVLLLALSGCSFFATNAPRPAPKPTACNREMKPVVTDAIVSIGATVAAGIAAVQHAGSTDVVVPIGVAGTFGASTVYGFVQVGRCRTEYRKRPTWTLGDMPAVM